MGPPRLTPQVLTRMNSPSDNNFAAADGSLGQLSFTTTVLNPSFHALNSVVNNINPQPNQFTGGQGPVTGQEVQFNVTFNTPFLLGPDHVFFRPEVDLGSAGDFLWLSAPKPIVSPGTPFTPDLQTWTRTDGTGRWRPIGRGSAPISPIRDRSMPRSPCQDKSSQNHPACCSWASGWPSWRPGGKCDVDPDHGGWRGWRRRPDRQRGASSGDTIPNSEKNQQPPAEPVV